ncbi:hypothetical protein LCGC14_0390250 [marine sediment metagenome]|uniref:Uncharacterized protein n=1 Tax=marine sediment metagenome TaxID=412755 RepID=A0A0F9W8W4_9ZZZZ
MFKIIDVVAGPIRLPAYDDKLDLGNIVSIKTVDGDIGFTLGNSLNPFGIIAKADCSGILSVFCSMIIFQTDKFEHDQKYDKGDLLYSNDCGIFTNRKVDDNALLLGAVNDNYFNENSYIEIRLI